jgi:hypothetical protein
MSVAFLAAFAYLYTYLAVLCIFRLPKCMLSRSAPPISHHQQPFNMGKPKDDEVTVIGIDLGFQSEAHSSKSCKRVRCMLTMLLLLRHEGCGFVCREQNQGH